MALTPEQIAEMNKIAGRTPQASLPTATPQVSPQDRIAQLRKSRAESRFLGTEERKKSLPEKIASFTGGEKIAKGLGQALAQRGTRKSLENVQTQQFGTQADLIKRIRENRALGKDTTRLEKALVSLGRDITDVGYGTGALLNPEKLTRKQVIGDALQLAATASAGKVAGALGGKAAAAAPTLGKGLKLGAMAGVKSGAVLGTVGGAAQGLKADKDAKGVIGSAVTGGVIGAAAGGVIGAATGAITGKLNSVRALKSTVGNHVKSAKDTIDAMPEEKIKELGGRGKLFEQNKKNIADQLRFKGLVKQADKLDDLDVSNVTQFDDYDRLIQNTLNKSTKETRKALNALTPDTRTFTPTEYKKLVRQGRIQPKAGVRGVDKYLTSTDELIVADKYADKIVKDPVKNVQMFGKEVAKLDDQVGTHLKKHNAIFNTGELRNSLDDALEDVVDLTVSEDRMINLKKKTIESFIDNLDKNDMESLWKARKAFDRNIETAFRGAPSAQKEMKKAFRNAVQDFISERTDDVTYKALMKDMSRIINVTDIQTNLASKVRGTNWIQQWLKQNPVTAKVLGFAIPAGVVGQLGISALKE